MQCDTYDPIVAVENHRVVSVFSRHFIKVLNVLNNLKEQKQEENESMLMNTCT